ncbi:serine/threonine-protein kinase [Engelhardtia mirabilis]|uniref:Serine/threonine-protein kinase PknB n=1 Tax=Engelhardtia mirabilis TaxID=2528011 RepID=A0A518BE12_9BACT|nr:Serine/threonine-protein kinase PknB [Planctomycetes bacterium Pla133]QDU99551.1 Serine/threonine-protein kinase PknB [Planctomycetes bacterium Pla86]
MDPAQRERLETLFHASRERAAGPEREAFLDGACGEDRELRDRVDALLAAHDASAEFLESPAVEPGFEGPGAWIGPYKLLQQIGEGGMGVVYMAEQTSPVTRKVALKVIKLGMDTKQVIARFEAERQALAMMDHPCIARVLDAGATEAGRPYFVMELVRGVAIHKYCDTHKLPTDERLRLFVDVCRAVQHAHQKGVIHRDLKPANVLVTSHDGQPVPKIIDFGVAKATNQRLTERTLFTEFHQVIGTPEYMSPEQAEMSGLDVDTRSDIYALGVLLYQLLTGTTPVDPTELRTAGFEEMTRMIREDEPPAPSTRVSKLGADADGIAKSRASDAGSLSRLFRGDLDWIVMKALEKDRTRRYETAASFAQDVVRHLEHKPVEAGPPGSFYRLRKFTGRHRRAAAAALVLLAVVGLGLFGTISGYLEARAEVARSKAISDSLQDVLAMTDAARASDPAEVEAVLATVRAVFGEEDATYAAVLDTLVERLHDAGDFTRATELCRESLGVWQRVHGEDHPNVAIGLGHLGQLLRLQGEDDEAEQSLRRSLALLEGASDAPGLAGYEARIELADLLANRGDFAEADALFGEALEQLRAGSSPSGSRILTTLEQRLIVQVNSGSSSAIETLRQIYDETRDFYGDQGPIVAVSAMSLGSYLAQRGAAEQAEPYLREAIERFRACGHARGTYYLAANDALFQIVRTRKDRASIVEADRMLREMIELARPIWGADALASNLKYYASRMSERGLLEDALEALAEAHQVLLDAGRSIGERESLRDNLVVIAYRLALRPGLERASYDLAAGAVERALVEEPTHPAMLTAKAVARYRLGDNAAAAELLDRLPGSLTSIQGGLAAEMAPADHAFRAMAHARLGHDEVAAAQLTLLRATYADRALDTEAAALLREVEAVVEGTPSADVGG